MHLNSTSSNYFQLKKNSILFNENSLPTNECFRRYFFAFKAYFQNVENLDIAQYTFIGVQMETDIGIFFYFSSTFRCGETGKRCTRYNENNQYFEHFFFFFFFYVWMEPTTSFRRHSCLMASYFDLYTNSCLSNAKIFCSSACMHLFYPFYAVSIRKKSNPRGGHKSLLSFSIRFEQQCNVKIM